MKVNGQAIHRSRPIGFNGDTPLLFTKGADGATYAILLQDEKTTALPDKISIPQNLASKNAQVFLLGSRNRLRTQAASDGSLNVLLPDNVRKNPPCQHAWVFKF
jgi:alpha-L-fucosidase